MFSWAITWVFLAGAQKVHVENVSELFCPYHTYHPYQSIHHVQHHGICGPMPQDIVAIAAILAKFEWACNLRAAGGFPIWTCPSFFVFFLSLFFRGFS